MPSLIAFNRRWDIGSDDLALPFLIETFVRGSWFIALMILSFTHQNSMGCAETLKLYVGLTNFLLSLAILFNISIIMYSMRGTITQTRPRRYIPLLLYLRFSLFIPEVITQMIGTIWSMSSQAPKCISPSALSFVQVAVLVGWALLGAALIGVALVFNPAGSVQKNNHRVGDIEQPGDHHQKPPLHLNLDEDELCKVHRKWEQRFKLLCCCFLKSNECQDNKYHDVARLFASYFEDVDVVPTDIVAGLILLQHKQNRESAPLHKLSPISRLSETPESFSSTGGIQGSVVSSPSPPITSLPPHPTRQPWMTPALAAHYMKFPVGTYGWPQYIYTHCLKGLWNLGCTSWFCCKGRQQEVSVIDDNCCHWHFRALELTTGLLDQDVIYCSFRNNIYEVPFLVAVDHQTSSIVVAIRGTLSVYDAVTDLTIQSEMVVLEQGRVAFTAHRGMLLAARYVVRQLEDSEALVKALTKHPSYNVVLLGHSLGAGTAALAACLLREFYPNLRCFCFAPPGGLLTWDGVKYCEDFIMTVVLGDDVVPRLSLRSMEDLKQRVLDCLIECDKPKYKVLLFKIFPLDDGFSNNGVASSPSESVESLQTSRPLLDSAGAVLNRERIRHYTEPQDASSSLDSGDCRQLLYPPGCILHIVEQDEGYTSRWVGPEAFSQIIISHRMLITHFPSTMYTALQEYSRQLSDLP